jgi:hypothetical protein
VTIPIRISPVLNDEQLDNDGLPLIGGTISTYLAGTSTLATTYTTINGTVAQANPIVLNARGEPDNPIWLAAGQAYKLRLFDAYGLLLREYDNISGVNDVAADTLTYTEWVVSGLTPTFINATQFSVVGDQTQIFSKYRRTKSKVAAGTAYGTITVSAFSAGKTTITQVNDALPLDAGLSAVWYGFNTLQSAPGLIQPGTVMPFYQAAAPQGFTQVVTHNDYMMRIVSTAGGGYGGTDSPIIMDKVPAHTHTFTSASTSVDHTHTYTMPNAPSGTFDAGIFPLVQANTAGTATSNSSSTAHTHTGTTDALSGAANWVPKYMNFILATKD